MAPFAGRWLAPLAGLILHAACEDDPAPAPSAGTAGGALASYGASACASCLRDACAEPLDACKGEPDCTAWLECVDGCPVDPEGGVDASCEASCGDAPPVAGAAVQAALEGCQERAAADCTDCGSGGAGPGSTLPVLNQHCQPSSADDRCERCLADECCVSESVCVLSDECAQVHSCINDCGPASCWKACFDANPKGAKEVLERFVCLFAFCATAEACFDENDPDLDCDNAHCMESRSLCWLDPDCYFLTVCMSECDEDAECEEACRAQVDFDVEQAFDTWATCFFVSC
jgi:hypothetical protein